MSHGPQASATPMRADICTNDDHDTIAALLEALAAVGAQYDEPDSFDSSESPLGVGLHRFQAGPNVLSVFVDAWGVDLEGPDELVNRVLDNMASPGR
ncbi:MAG TPA: hypothetical protein VKE74_31310 [Gemmataceae bacterium]|nr:hypothetical protein [Gemmataceae bacterium]